MCLRPGETYRSSSVVARVLQRSGQLIRGDVEVQPWGTPNIRLKDPLLPCPALPAAGTVARQALATCTPSTLPWSHHHAHVPSCFIT